MKKKMKEIKAKERGLCMTMGKSKMKITIYDIWKICIYD